MFILSPKGLSMLAKKGITVWLFTSLTFTSLLHLTDAITAIILNQQSKLLPLYPYISDKLQTITPTTYLYITAATSLILWAITCLIIFENPVETFLNKILSDAKRQSQTETQTVQDKSELLDIMYENVESQQETLAQVKDLICTVRSDVKEIEPLKQTIQKTTAELTTLKTTIKRIEDKIIYTNICIACGKPIQPEFKLCPYCGEPTKLPTAAVIDLKNYK
jgi:RNA polymerase-binding transcription factor DksA